MVLRYPIYDYVIYDIIYGTKTNFLLNLTSFITFIYEDIVRFFFRHIIAHI